MRVDHVDGLGDPAAYCRKLRRTLTEAGGRRPYIVVEKILAAGKSLPADWETDGTTGYDFMAEVGGLLHDPAGEAPLTQLWTGTTGCRAGFSTVETDLRAELVHRMFGAELARTVNALDAAEGRLAGGVTGARHSGDRKPFPGFTGCTRMARWGLSIGRLPRRGTPCLARTGCGWNARMTCSGRGKGGSRC